VTRCGCSSQYCATFILPSPIILSLIVCSCSSDLSVGRCSHVSSQKRAKWASCSSQKLWFSYHRSIFPSIILDRRSWSVSLQMNPILRGDIFGIFPLPTPSPKHFWTFDPSLVNFRRHGLDQPLGFF
jgi:hypothetical protein